MTESEIVQRLQVIENEADRIMNLFVNGLVVPRNQVEQAQVWFRGLKEKLDTEYRRMDTLKGRAKLSQIELAFYKPAISNAWANSGISSVRWDSHPNNRWHTALYDVRSYMGHWISNLKRTK